MSRIRTVLTAVVFWLGIAGAVIAIVLEELGGHIDQPVVAWIVGLLGPALTVVGVLVAIIRRVTPVLPDQRGLLPVARNGVVVDPDSFIGQRPG